MAADNYSDVVQVLAKQIVDTCMQMLRKNFQGLMAGVTINADQIDGEVSNISTTSLTIDTDHIPGLNQYVADMIAGAEIDISQIARVGDDGRLYLDNVYIQREQVDDLEARFAEIWRADIFEADIQTALIDALHANFAEIAEAAIGNAKIDTAQIEDLQAAVAHIADAQIENAEIDFAQIKALSANDVIIQKGLGGKLYIADLAVTEANMVSLTVGELIVKGNDGGFYALTIDEEGRVSTERKTVSNGDLEDLSVTGSKIADGTINGDEKIIESSITARTLNVQDIFAQNAMVLKLIAQNINVDELFANQAFINHLNTADISGNSSLRLAVQAAQEETMREVEIRLSEDAIVSTVTGSDRFQELLDEKTRQTVTVWYCVWDSGTVRPGDTADWQREIPDTQGGGYLWTKTVTTYGNGGAPSVVYAVAQIGTNTADGIVLRISSASGATRRPGDTEMKLSARVYAGNKLLSQAETNLLGRILWFVDEEAVPASAYDSWNEVTIDLTDAGANAAVTARLVG